MRVRERMVVVLVVLFTFLLHASPSFAARFTFTFATHATPDSFRGSAEEGYLKEVERLTDGTVSFKIFWGSSLMGGQEILKGVGDGIVDAGIVNINFYAKQLLFNNALNTIQESAGSFPAMLAFFNKAYEELPELRGEFARNNNEVLAIYGVMNYAFASTRPLTAITGIKGMKTRSASRWQLPLFTEMGALPVSVPWDDCTMALQTNVIDAVFSNLDAINMVKMEEAAPHVLLFEQFFPSTPYVLTMNAKKFAKLPPEIQAAFRQAAGTMQEKLAAEYQTWYRSIRQSHEKGRITVTLATDEDVRIWQSLSGIEANKKQWIEEAAKAGADDAAAFLDKVYRIFNETRVSN